MSNEEKKRPSWYHPIARANYDAMRTAYNEVMARVLPADEAAKTDIELPPSWRTKPMEWILTGLGQKHIPEGTGVGLVQSPYADIYTRTYGVQPIADLPKYRQMFRTQPDIQSAVELQVNMAIGKGFTISHPDKKIQTFIEKLCDDIDLLQTMITMAHDMLVYGNAYGEIQWADAPKKQEQLYEYAGAYYTASDLKTFNASAGEIKPVVGADQKPLVAQSIQKGTSKTIVGIKPLDPVYMRVRRDSWGNVYGYIQWISFPPVLIDTDSLIHIRYRPKSTGYEGAYGTSILMSLIKNNDLLEHFENDAAVWIHSRAVPPLIVKGGGDPQHPYSTNQMKDLMEKLKERSAASMLCVKSDVEISELAGIARNMNLTWWMQYLLRRRYQALGVPPILLGVPEGTNRATSEVVFQDFITRLQLIQEFIADPIETLIFKPIIEAEFGKGHERARIKWKPIVEADRNRREASILQGLQAGAMSINEYREGIGLKTLDDPKYDEVLGHPTVGIGGFGGAGGGAPSSNIPAPSPPAKTPSTSAKQEELSPEQAFRVKKMRLLVSSENFKNEMLEIVRLAKLEFRMGDKKVKDIKKEMSEKAENVIGKYIGDAYLYGKMDTLYGAVAKEGKTVSEFDMSIKQEDLPKIVELKKKYVKDFDEILKDMTKAKEEGLL